MNLYFFEGYTKGNTDELVYKAAVSYIMEKGLDGSKMDLTINRSEAGKPYFKDAPIHFSVSHTGPMFLCIMGDEAVGIDIEEKIPEDIDKLAERFFMDEEVYHVDLWGEDGFLDIWVRKEAVAKFLGTSVFDACSNIKVADKDGLLDQVETSQGQVFVEEIDMGFNIKCVYASKVKEELCLRGLV